MKLLIDVGNTRIKWAWFDGERLLDQQACMRDDDVVPQDARDAWSAQPAAQVWFSSVASPIFNHNMQTYWQTQAVDVRSVAVVDYLSLLPTCYRDPARLGVDRWLAMLAAWQRAQRAVCVVVCGTAMTVDWIDDHGVHQGGIIVPGLQRMQDSLSLAPGIATAGASHEQDQRLGRDTQNGLRIGAEMALVGAVAQFLDQQQPKACYISGGNGELVAARLGAAVEYQADLVLQGLACLAKGYE